MSTVDSKQPMFVPFPPREEDSQGKIMNTVLDSYRHIADPCGEDLNNAAFAMLAALPSGSITGHGFNNLKPALCVAIQAYLDTTLLSQPSAPATVPQVVQAPIELPELPRLIPTDYLGIQQAMMDYARKAIASLAAPSTAAEQASDVRNAALTSKQIEAGWHETFSTNNPYCPCNLKSFTRL